MRGPAAWTAVEGCAENWWRELKAKPFRTATSPAKAAKYIDGGLVGRFENQNVQNSLEFKNSRKKH